MKPNLKISRSEGILGVARAYQAASTMLENFRTSHVAIYSVLIYAFSANAISQTFGTSSHTITVTVATINNIQVSSGTVNLTISGSSAIAGQNAMSVTDQSTTFLWGINSSLKKVTVQTNLASQQFALKVVALNPTQGTASTEVTLSTTANDFLTNLGRSSGNCTIKYTGVALASQGTGTDSHTITFTIQTQ